MFVMSVIVVTLTLTRCDVCHVCHCHYVDTDALQCLSCLPLSLCWLTRCSVCHVCHCRYVDTDTLQCLSCLPLSLCWHWHVAMFVMSAIVIMLTLTTTCVSTVYKVCQKVPTMNFANLSTTTNCCHTNFCTVNNQLFLHSHAKFCWNIHKSDEILLL